MKNILKYIMQFMLAAIFAVYADLTVNLREYGYYPSYELLYLKQSLKFLCVLMLLQFVITLFLKVDYKGKLKIVIITAVLYIILSIFAYSTLYIF